MKWFLSNYKVIENTVRYPEYSDDYSTITLIHPSGASISPIWIPVRVS